MYIWIGIDTESQLAAIKHEVLKIENNLNLTHSTLPLHISLKMSFKANDSAREAIINDLLNYSNTLNSFDIETNGIDYEKIICWILMKRNNNLDAIHDYLNDFLKQKYDIPLHEYDQDYKYHTTLFMNEDKNKIFTAYKKIAEISIPAKIKANTILIGESPNGAIGTYRVTHTLDIAGR